MAFLESADIVRILLVVGVLLGLARLLGEVARRIHQPAVLGELTAGVLLGPTVLGNLAPAAHAYLLPETGPAPFVLNGFANVALVFFLLVAGMEVDLSSVWRQGRAAVLVTLFGVTIPFGLGVGAALMAPASMGASAGVDATVFALFLGTALSISALPVIVKTLMDLGVLRSDLGVVVVPAAIAQDLVGWLVFAFVLGLMGSSKTQVPIATTLTLGLLFVAFMLSMGRWILHRVLPWVHSVFSWPGGVLGLTATLALLAGAFTEWLGIHAVFGAFMFGVAIGDSRHMRQQTRATLDEFVNFVFAPLFFASIGLRVDFVAHLDVGLAVGITALATVGKVVGGGLGARLGGLPLRQALAVGIATNSRGAMEIILGLVALRLGLVTERLFVALVVMALATSIMAGPLLTIVLRMRKRKHFSNYLRPACFVPRLEAVTSTEVVRELARAVAVAHNLSEGDVVRAVLERENRMSTGLEHGVAVPHAYFDGVRRPIVALGVSKAGIDFGCLDGGPATIIVLVLAPPDDADAQLQVLADVAYTLRAERVRTELHQATTFSEALAALRLGAVAGSHYSADPSR